MSMSTYVKGISEDSLYEDYKLIFYKCDALGINIPAEILEYFQYSDPDQVEGRVIELPKESYSKFVKGTIDILQVDLRKLPKDIKYLRFCNSY